MICPGRKGIAEGGFANPTLYNLKRNILFAEAKPACLKKATNLFAFYNAAAIAQ